MSRAVWFHCQSYVTDLCFFLYKAAYFVVLFVQESFARAQSWISELQKQASPNIIIALAGNKTDLENLRAVQYDVCVVCTFFVGTSFFGFLFRSALLCCCFGDRKVVLH